MYRAAQKSKPQPKPKTDMQIEGAVDLTSDKFPTVPERQGPTVPTDDPYRKYRTSKA